MWGNTMVPAFYKSVVTALVGSSASLKASLKLKSYVSISKKKFNLSQQTFIALISA